MSRVCQVTGKRPTVGNNRSHARNATRRRFLPNLTKATLISDALGRSVSLRISTHALRSVEHNDGLDNFLLKARDADLSANALKLKKEIKGMTSEVVDILKGAERRGNIRELKNVMERSAIVCDEEVTVQDLPIDLQCAGMDEEQGKEEFELAVIEQKHITKVLQYTRGNKTEAARLLKIGLATLYRKIEAYHISV